VTTRDIMEGTLIGGMDGIFKAFSSIPTRPPFDKQEADKRNRQQAYMADFRATAVPMLREVLNNRMLIARINAARVLHRFAVDGHEEVADDCVRILETTQEHDAVKVWAVKGIGEVLGQYANKTPKDAKRLDKAALAVYAWLEARCKVSPQLLADMQPDEHEAVRYLRREAIKALGSYRRPMIVDDPKTGTRQGPVAGLLVRIMVGDENAVSPSASITEREEAAYGLCLMQSKLSPTYQPDYVLHQWGRFIAALGAEANFDPDRKKQRWQYFASHLKAGADTLATDFPRNSPTSVYLTNMMARVNPVLEYLYDKEKFAGEVTVLSQWLNDNPPKAQEDVYNPPVALLAQVLGEPLRPAGR
jgi:hypothetical protein